MKKIALKKRLPAPRRCREECKVTCDPIKRPMVGGPGSLPPKRKLIAIRKEPEKAVEVKKEEKLPIMKTGGAGRGLPPKPELKPIKPKMMGGPGSLPPPRVEKKAEEKKVIKPVEAPKVGGKGSLPPKPVLQKVEAPKKIEAPKIEKKEAKMVGGPGSLPPKPKIEKAEVKKPAPAPAKKVEDKED